FVVSVVRRYHPPPLQLKRSPRPQLPLAPKRFLPAAREPPDHAVDARPAILRIGPAEYLPTDNAAHGQRRQPISVPQRNKKNGDYSMRGRIPCATALATPPLPLQSVHQPCTTSTARDRGLDTKDPQDIRIATTRTVGGHLSPITA